MKKQLSPAAKGFQKRQRRYVLTCIFLLLLTLVLAGMMMVYGNTIYSPKTVFQVLSGADINGAAFTIRTLRFPRMLTGILCGLAFGLAGNKMCIRDRFLYESFRNLQRLVLNQQMLFSLFLFHYKGNLRFLSTLFPFTYCSFLYNFCVLFIEFLLLHSYSRHRIRFFRKLFDIPGSAHNPFHTAGSFPDKSP